MKEGNAVEDVNKEGRVLVNARINLFIILRIYEFVVEREGLKGLKGQQWGRNGLIEILQTNSTTFSNVLNGKTTQGLTFKGLCQDMGHTGKPLKNT